MKALKLRDLYQESVITSKYILNLILALEDESVEPDHAIGLGDRTLNGMYLLKDRDPTSTPSDPEEPTLLDDEDPAPHYDEGHSTGARSLSIHRSLLRLNGEYAGHGSSIGDKTHFRQAKSSSEGTTTPSRTP